MLRWFARLSERQLPWLVSAGIFLSILILFLPVVIFGIQRVVRQGEQRYTEQEVVRAVKIIENESAGLDNTALDYSAWDETYQFAQDANPEYIEANLYPEAIANLGVDAVIVFDAQGQLLLAQFVDRETQTDIRPPFSVQALMDAYPLLLDQADIHAGRYGLARVGDLPMFVAARPILTSEREGPSVGTFLLLRLLNAQELDTISELALRTVNLFLTDRLPAELPAPVDGQIVVLPRDNDTVLGYQVLRDLNGQAQFVLEIENQRDLYRQGRVTTQIFAGILFLIGFLLLSGSFHFSRSLIRSRSLGRQYLERFQAIFHHSSDSILLVNPDLRVLETNPTSRDLLGLDPGTRPLPLLPELLSFSPALDSSLLAALSTSGHVSEHRCVRGDGAQFFVELTASRVNDLGRQAFALIVRDVTARKAAEVALKHSEERYTLAANGANDGLWDWNLATGEIYYSPRWKAMIGGDAGDLLPSPDEWFNRIHPEDRLTVQTRLSDHLRDRTDKFECEYRLQHKDGQYYWMLARGLAVWDPAGFPRRIAGSQTDINLRKLLEEQLRYDALHDGLTGIGNRTLLIDHLSHVNERKKRNADLLFALFFMDFDRFKQVNDTLGHHIGDLVLIEAAHRLEHGLRSVDTVSRFTGPETLARIAGDEFVVLLEDFKNREDVERVADRILSLFATPFVIAGHKINLTVSVGLVIPEQPYEQMDDILRDADIAMYRAKQAGGGRVVTFSQEMYLGTVSRMKLESDLRTAVERREFAVVYQPIVALHDNRVTGFEALVRWNHPERGLLLPGDFIQEAEEIGAIIPIGYFVLEEACRTMQAWRAKLELPFDLIVSVNLSAKQMMAPDLIPVIQSILQKTAFEPNRLWFEITESTLLRSDESVVTRLNELRAMGIRIEIDDFGTGYSSLSYLQNLPVDGIKIDRSFVTEINPGRQSILSTLVNLAHNLGLVEIAEGVETAQQRDFLVQTECQFAQGYLIARPMPSSDIETLLKAIRADAALLQTGQNACEAPPA